MAYQFDQLNKEARQLLSTAHLEAKKLQHRSTGPEHILLALLLHAEQIKHPLAKSFTINSTQAREQLALNNSLSKANEVTPPTQVIIHNDDTTPFDYVVGLLVDIFKLSTTAATKVAQTVNETGGGLVAILPYHEAREKANIAQATAKKAGYPLTLTVFAEKIELSPTGNDIVTQAAIESLEMEHGYIGVEHILLGLISVGGGSLDYLLKSANLNFAQIQADTSTKKIKWPTRPTLPSPSINISSFPISPIFLLLVLITAVAGYATYEGWFNRSLTVFLFVAGGWLISLCLHEFGHALVAFLGGDKSVVDKGYLTLDPLKYTHPLLSLFLPLVFLAMGGIGLPGGAVYIDRNAIKDKRVHSLVSAAGPLATAFCAIICLAPFALEINDTLIANLSILLMGNEELNNHTAFWAATALLGFLQITALFFNLLPIPPLDGFGIIEPFLPKDIAQSARQFGFLGIIILFFVLSSNNPLTDAFWESVLGISEFFNLNRYLISAGFDLFQFWS